MGRATGTSRRMPVRRVLLGAAVAPLVLTLGCSSDDGATDSTTTTAASSAEHVLRVGVVSIGELDPARAVPTQPGQMMGIDLLYDGLTSIDPETALAAPSLAESWESNDDFTEWSFTLRDDAAFSDGTAVTGEDVQASLERVAVEGTRSLAGVRLDVIEGYGDFVAGDEDHISGIDVSDDGRTVEITTTQAFAPLPELLGSPIFGVVPTAMLADDEEAFFADAVGSGPMMLAGDDAETEAARRRPDGSDDVRVLVPAPGSSLDIDAVELFHFDELADSYAAFVDGELDWSLVPTDEVDSAVEEYGADAMTPFHAEFFYGINLSDPTYADRDFREAIVRAVDREKLVADFFPNSTQLNGTVVDGVPGFQDDPCGEPCSYSPDAVADLLDEAFPDGDVPTVTLDFYEGTREQAVAERIASDLDDAGIPAELRPQPASDYETFVTSGDQEVFLFGWVGIAPTADSYLAPLFLSGSLDNVTSFGSDAVDAGLAAARAFESADERADAYQAVEETVMAQVPVIPLVQVNTLAVTSERVQGWTPQLDGTFVVGAVSLDG